MLAPAALRVTSVEGITEYRLPNGLRVLLFPDLSKRTVTVNMTYLVGSRHENYGETGMAHLLEHLLFKGSKNYPDVPKAFSDHGAYWNGTTWTDRTNYFETVPATDANLQWALAFEADRMVNSFIARKDLETEFTVVRNELEQGENAPARVLNQRVAAAAYEWHNYGKSTIGARSDVENVPIDRLQAFYWRFYQPDNAVLTVAGHFDEARTIALVRTIFGRIARPSRTLPRIYTEEPVQDGERTVTVRRVGDVQMLRTAHHVPPAAHADFAPIEILFEVLGNTPAGRLHQTLVEPGLATAAGAYADAMFDPALAWTTVTLRKDAPLEPAGQGMLEVLDGLATKAPTPEEVDRARARLLKQIDLELAASDQIGLSMSEYIAAGDWRLFFLRRDRIREVTVDDVRRVAAAYIKPANRTVGMFIPSDAPDRSAIPTRPDLAALFKDYRGNANMRAGEAFDPSPANIEARTTRLTTTSGVRLALLPKSTRGGKVTVAFSTRLGSEQDLTGRPIGVGIFTGNLLMRGTTTRTRQQIQDELDKLSANMSLAGNPANAAGLIETTREHLPGVLTLLADVLRHPAFPVNEFEQLRRQMIQALEAQRQQPAPAATLRMNQHLDAYPVGHPRHVVTIDARIAAYRGLSIEDIRTFHRDFYGAGSTTLSIVGDFDARAATEAAEQLFAGWTSAKPFVRLTTAYRDAPPLNETIETPDKANAAFRAGLSLRVRQDDPDYAALLLGNYMLGGDFNSRIVARLRQKEGLSYGAGSGLTVDVFDPAALFTASAIAAPENIVKLESAFREEVDRALKEGFTPGEMKTAKAGWLQTSQIDRADDFALAATLREYLFHGRTLNWDRDLEERILALTPADVVAAMRRHIDPSKISVVKAGDFAKLRAGARP
jgi:zinc protease